MRQQKNNINKNQNSQKPNKGGNNRHEGNNNFTPSRGHNNKDRSKKTTTADNNIIWGTHAVESAIKNENREIIEIIHTKNCDLRIPSHIKTRITDIDSLNALVPFSAVHQGIVAKVHPLPSPNYDDVLANGGFIFVLDQLTDPQNIGSIFRTAAAFGAAAIIQQDRKAPAINGTIAKAAQGGIELIPDLRVVNISQTIKDLSDEGWLTIGLDMEGSAGPLAKVLENEKRPIALVLGTEGKGLRELVAKRCDLIAHIPMFGQMESLNVSNAAAIAAYEVTRVKGL